MRQAERKEATRAKLLESARRLFARDGFAVVAAETVARDAGLTRGALYHHFGGKEGLFSAVYEEIQREVTARVDSAAEREAGAWEALRAGSHTFLECCLDPEVQRIMLLDAPVALSWEEWRAVDARYGLGSLLAGLRAAAIEGALPEDALDATAHLLIGAMNEAAMWIARSGTPETALSEARAVLDRLLAGLRR